MGTVAVGTISEASRLAGGEIRVETGAMDRSQVRPHGGRAGRWSAVVLRKGRRLGLRWPALLAVIMGAMSLAAVSAGPLDDWSMTPAKTGESSIEPTAVAFRELASVKEPLWTDYALADALFWGRDNQAANLPLVVSTSTGAPLLSAADPQFAVAPGVRAFYGQRNPCDCGWEIGYFGVYGMTASRFTAVTPPDFLEFPGAMGPVLTADGQNATVKYLSTINSAEANVFSTWHEWRDYSESWLTVDWLAGFRYVGVEEQASIVMACCTDEAAVPYTVRTRNNMFGGQIGSRARWTWQRWAIEGWAKAGLLGNAEKQIQDPLFDYTGFQQRQARSATGSDVGFIGDLNLSVIYRLNEVWGIRAGYNTVWIGGVALAPNQFDFTNTTLSGTGLASGDGIFLNGANLGLEARW